MNPAAWSSRQKSLRGLAKCAAFASEWKPGLIPQKTTSRSGASTSGTALFETAATVAHPSAAEARTDRHRSMDQLGILRNGVGSARNLAAEVQVASRTSGARGRLTERRRRARPHARTRIDGGTCSDGRDVGGLQLAGSEGRVHAWLARARAWSRRRELGRARGLRPSRTYAHCLAALSRRIDARSCARRAASSSGRNPRRLEHLIRDERIPS